MLVLSRKVNQRIRIGQEIFVTVTAIRNGSVRIGIDAPPHVEIVRTELDFIYCTPREKRNEPTGTV